MRRRTFLNYSAASLPLIFNSLPKKLLSSEMLSSLAREQSDKILVLIELNGGNDGLNTLIPLDQYASLAQLRPNILLPQNSLPQLDSLHAIHPAFSAIRDVWDDGKLGIVQSVGYASQNRSHFRSLDIWRTAPENLETLTTGWMGRVLDLDHPGYPAGYPSNTNPDPIAITIGNSVSATCQGVGANYALTVSNPFNQTSILEGAGGAVPNTEHGSELEFLRTKLKQTNVYTSIVKDRAEAGNTIAPYPTNNMLADQLQYVAQMISGGLETKIYTVCLGGFDTHGDQVEAGNAALGNHPSLLKTLGDAIAAFQADLQALNLEQRVIGMTYSEFGRRILENGGLGTDHGDAAPMFLFGSCVNPGILGTNPTIDVVTSRGEGVPMQYDFRDVYGSVLEDWFGFSENDVKSVLSNNYSKLPIINPCGISSVDSKASAKTEITISPSPFRNNTRLKFSLPKKGLVRVNVYDVTGTLIETLFERRLPAGDQNVQIDTRSYPAGPIIFHLKQDSEVKVIRGIKM